MISLDGEWEAGDDEGEFTFTGTVPGTVQGGLILQKLVPHPYVVPRELGHRENYFRTINY